MKPEIEKCISHVLKYSKPSDYHAMLELLKTFALKVLIFVLYYYHWSFAGTVLSICTLIRLFIIFHDTGHYAYFSNIKSNRIVGRIIGICISFPYDSWRDGHTQHHQSFGNVDKPFT